MFEDLAGYDEAKWRTQEAIPKAQRQWRFREFKCKETQVVNAIAGKAIGLLRSGFRSRERAADRARQGLSY